MGLAMARVRPTRRPTQTGVAGPIVVYASSEAHMSIGKAVALLGLGRDNLRLLPVGDDFRLSPYRAARRRSRSIEQPAGCQNAAGD